MNKEARSRNRGRAYESRLRKEQAEQTRERILDAAIRAISASDRKGVTLAEVARRAGVSEPTLYRHFGSRDRLYEEMERRAAAEIGLPPFPMSLADFPRHVAQLFRVFGAHEPLIRALTRSGLGRTIRKRGRVRRTRLLRERIRAHAPHLDEEAVERGMGVLRVLVSWESYDKLTGEVGLSVESSAEAVASAVRAVIRDIGEQDAAARGRPGGVVHAGARGEAG